MNKQKTLLAILLPTLLLAGCASERTAASGGSTPAASQNLQLAFVTNNASDFWTIARKGVERADAELANVSVEFLMPGDGTAAEQKRLVDDLLAKGVDGIAISPVDPANQTDMLNNAAKQALLVTQDSDAPESDRAAYVGTDNVAAGRQAGEELKKALPNGGKVMVFVGMKDAQNAKDRLAGLREAIQGTDIQILDVRTDETDRAKAKSNVADTLVNVPDVAGLVGLWSYNGPAILNAVKESGKAGKVKIVCFDEEDETLDGVKSGDIFATIVQQPYEFGYQSVRLMAEVKFGKGDGIPDNKLLIVPTLVVRADNVEEFRKKLDELRGRS
ncbi:MAG TPA: sugar-binding protein [Fimbriimonadaceae bacterium]|nr:sugar-binding protein [Fimbriimonadaceae bacterium]